jgi:hypothetical protein
LAAPVLDTTRMSRPTADLAPGLRRLLTASGVTFGVCLALALLDVLAGVRLPGAVRPLLPWVMAASMLLATTLLVGALGMPARPSLEEGDPDGGA